EQDVRARRGDKLDADAVETPQRGAQTRVRVLLRDLRPEHAGDMDAAERMLTQREEREESLGAERENERLALADELEAPQEPQSENRRRDGFPARRFTFHARDRSLPRSHRPLLHRPYASKKDRSTIAASRP